MASLKPAPRTKSVEVPKSKPIITTPEPDVIIPESPTDYLNEPMEEVTERMEFDDVETMVEEPSDSPREVDFGEWAVNEGDEIASDDPSPLASDTDGDADGESGSGYFEGDFEGEAESGDNPFADGFFSGDWPDGDGTEGKNLGVGKVGDGQYWGDFAGDGLFNRKVIKRANVARLAHREGKLVVNLCVDQSGEVVFVECDKSKSTILDSKLVTMAEDCASNYIFDNDPTAPEKQCGRLTFIFKID